MKKKRKYPNGFYNDTRDNERVAHEFLVEMRRHNVGWPNRWRRCTLHKLYGLRYKRDEADYEALDHYCFDKVKWVM